MYGVMIEKEKLIEILNDWNFWTRDQKTGIFRSGYIEKLERLSKTKQIIIVMGVRRSGKSTIIKQHIMHLIRKGVDRKNFLYVNFEEPRFINELSLSVLQQIYDAYREIIKPTAKPHIFLDEVQLVSGWERFARALHEKEEATIFVSGSSAKLLSKELATTLTGRHVDLEVYPLNFKEFLEFKGMKIKTKLDILSNKLKIKQLLREYIEFGGFPLVVLQEEKNEILARYFDDIVSKDISERYKIKKINKLKTLAKYYLTNVGSFASFRKIKEFIGISLDSVERFSYYLNDAYMIFLVNKFAYSLKEQEVNPKKIYCIDSGLKNIVGFKFSEEIGHLYENLVFLELFQKRKELYYWKDKGECDFIVKERTKVKDAIQVCYNLENNKEREMEGLLSAMNEFNLSEGFIITEEYEGEERIKGKKIKFIPLWRWLLE